MKILVIGGGGREHALVWKISQSKKVDKIFCAPGNAGIAALAECIDIKDDNIPALKKFPSWITRSILPSSGRRALLPRG